MVGRCPICQDIFTPMAAVSATPCGHTFHAECLLAWIRQSRTCPTCRLPAPETRIIPLFFDKGEDSIAESPVPVPGPSVEDLQNQVHDLEGELDERAKEFGDLTQQLSRERALLANEREKSRRLEVSVAALQKQAAAVKENSKKTGKKEKDLFSPKRPKCGYFYFAKEKRKELWSLRPDLKSQQVEQELGRRWKEMRPLDKLPYEQLSAKDKLRYQQEMKEYQARKAVVPTAALAPSGSGGLEAFGFGTGTHQGLQLP